MRNQKVILLIDKKKIPLKEIWLYEEENGFEAIQPYGYGVIRLYKGGRVMAVQLIVAKCPACGADVSVESTKEFSFCTYCGTKIMISNENVHIYRNIDEAKIKEAETDRIIRLRKLELEEKEKERGQNSILLAYGSALVFFLVGTLINWAHGSSGPIVMLIGIYIALLTFAKGEKKKKNEKRKLMGPDEAAITKSMKNYREKNFNSIVLLFKGAGFTNVTAIPLNDLTMFNQKKNGQVESVTINGSDEFEEEDIFPKNSNILITYHSR